MGRRIGSPRPEHVVPPFPLPGTVVAAGTAGTLICEAERPCTAGQECQTACAGTGAAGTSTFCTCAPAGGNSRELACISIPCNRDAGAGSDGGPAIAACPNGIQNDDDYTSPADTICATACAAQMQTRCVCVPRGGGGGARWMCGAAGACR